MKKSIKLIYSIMMVTIIMITAIPVFAKGDAPTFKVVYCSAVEGESYEGGGFITPREASHLNASHTGSAYYGNFSCAANSGTKLNIYVNNKSNQPVKFAVTGGGTTHSTTTVNGKTSSTRTFTMKNGGGVTGDWTVYVYNENGYSLDIDVSARQY